MSAKRLPVMLYQVGMYHLFYANEVPCVPIPKSLDAALSQELQRREAGKAI